MQRVECGIFQLTFVALPPVIIN